MNSVIKNFIWRFMERMLANIVAFVVSIILARILSPEEYGTIAIVSVIIVFFQVFVDCGFGNSLIQKKDADDLDFSTIFYFNIVACVFLYIILFFSAPLFSAFYKDTSLTNILRILGLIIVISGIKNIQQAYVSKKMMFRKFFFSTLSGTIAAAIVGIGMALNGFGVWALVAQQLINPIIDTIVLWFTVDWRPKKLFSFTRLKYLFNYGSKLLGTSLLSTLYNNISQLAIGKVYSSTDLAFYNKGKSWPNLFVQNINTSMDSVLFPSFSNIQDQKYLLKEKCKRANIVSALIIFPGLIGLALIAKPLVRVVLTEKWIQSVIFMQLFCLSFMTYPIQTANINVIKAVGESGTYLKCELIKRTVQIVFLIVALFISPLAVCVSFLLTNIIACFIFAYPNGRIIKYSFINQLKDLINIILAVMIMTLIVYMLGKIPVYDIIRILMMIILGCVSYIISLELLKVDAYIDIKNRLMNWCKDKFNKDK